MSNDPQDFICGGVVSNCCGARVLLGDMCAECGEHCEPESENEPSEIDRKIEESMHFGWVKGMPTPLENWQQNDEHNVP